MSGIIIEYIYPYKRSFLITHFELPTEEKLMKKNILVQIFYNKIKIRRLLQLHWEYGRGLFLRSRFSSTHPAHLPVKGG